MSDSLHPHGLQQARLLSHSLSLGVGSNSCPLRYYLSISPSAAPFSSCPQSFPASGSFPMSWLFTSGGPSIRASASASVLPMNIQGWFLLGLTGWISLKSKGLSRVFSNTTVWKEVQGTLKSLLQHHSLKVSILQCSVFLIVQLSHLYLTTGKIRALTICTYVGKVMSLLFNTPSRLVIAFLRILKT